MPADNPRGSSGSGTPNPTTIVFFGLGAVGSALLICLSELAERDEVPIRFVVYVLNPDAARDALFHAERLFDHIDFVGVPDFAPVFALAPEHEAELATASLLVNAALPKFNGSMIELALRIGAHTVDLASDMYDAATERTGVRSQFACEFRKIGLA